MSVTCICVGACSDCCVNETL